MNNYLSFGGGVNSVALHLLMLKEKVDFEAIFIDHATDWPETYTYLGMFQEWLKNEGHKSITVLKPNVEGFSSLYDYLWHYKMIPSFRLRFCTDKFKVRVVQQYVSTPCFMMLGIDAGEKKRAKISIKNGIENRFPLIEYDIDRDGCKKIIKDHGLPIPIKSGCYICPFQRVIQWRDLRRNKPDLFCKARKLEERATRFRVERGKTPVNISASNKKLSLLVGEDQMTLFKQDEYPPCQCGL